MDCYEIARRIMDKVRKMPQYMKGHSTSFRGISYYDSMDSLEYFTIHYSGIRALVMKGEIYKLEISDPRGIVLFNLRLWLLEIDRMTK